MPFRHARARLSDYDRARRPILHIRFLVTSLRLHESLNAIFLYLVPLLPRDIDRNGVGRCLDTTGGYHIRKYAVHLIVGSIGRAESVEGWGVAVPNYCESSTASTVKSLFWEGKMSEGLKKLYIDELKDLYSAETQLVKALPKMAAAASSDELRQGFEEHLEQTKGHVERLEKVFKVLGESPKGKTCKGMQGLIAEGAEVMDEDFEGSLMDAALIGAAQRVEHYEIAAYGTVCAFAKELGESDQASLLNETLEEEKETDEKLSEMSDQINTEANEGREEVEDQKKETVEARKKRSRRAA